MTENAKERPYWQYVSVLDSRTRPAHRALHGKVFRHDDPVWNYLYPPNGWRCRCRVRALTAADLKDQGITVESSKGKISFVDQPLGNSGQTIKTASYEGIGADGKRFTLTPDAGWDYNPGQAGSRWDVKGRLPDCGWLTTANFSEGGGCIKPFANQATWRTLGRPDLRDVPVSLRLPAPQILEAAVSREAAVDVMASALEISARNPLRVIVSPVEELAIRYEWLPHMVGKEADKRERYANFILPTLLNPFEIWAPLYDDGTIRERYIGLFQGDKDFMVVVRVNRDGALMWNVMQADSKKMNPHRLGGLLYEK